MVSKDITIKNEQGMHMRPASMLSQKATPFNCDVKILFNGNSYDCKSVMFLMSACIKCGSEIFGKKRESSTTEDSRYLVIDYCFSSEKQ